MTRYNLAWLLNLACVVAFSSVAIAHDDSADTDSVIVWSVVDPENEVPAQPADPVILQLAPKEQFPLGAGIRKRGTNQITVPYCVAVVDSANKPCAHIQYFQATVGPKTDANAIIDYSVGAPQKTNDAIDHKLVRTPIGPVFQGFEFSPEKFQGEMNKSLSRLPSKSHLKTHLLWNIPMTAANAAYWISILSTKNQLDQHVPWSMLPREWKIIGFAGLALQGAPYLYVLGRRIIAGSEGGRSEKRMYRAYLKSLGTHENWMLFLLSKKNQVSPSDYDYFVNSLKLMTTALSQKK